MKYYTHGHDQWFICCEKVNNADDVVLRKWTRAYRCRWHAWTGLSALAVTSASAALWNLAETISEGRKLGLTVAQILVGSSLAKPLDAYRLLAMASPSYIMFGTAFLCIVIMLFIRTDTQRNRLVLKFQAEIDVESRGGAVG